MPPSKRPCPICGGTAFGPGPRGRRGLHGALPRCLGCGALERHRAFRTALAPLAPAFAGARALQFSEDRSTPREPFAAYEVSVYGGPNHLDMAAIDRPANAYDVVVAHHVLEHVADDRAALAELDRILAPAGILVLSVPDLLRVPRTVEYGRARDDKFGHFRLYGPDIADRWRAAVPAWSALGLVATDPVTGAPDRLTLLSRAAPVLADLAARWRAAGFAPFDGMAPQRAVKAG